MQIERATARDRQELLDFLLGVFRRGNPKHPPFEDIYPDLFLEDDEVLGRHAVIREEGRIVSCVGTYLVPMQVGGCRVLTAGLGQVATAPESRGRGYMTALISHELDRCRAEGAALSWLGGRRDRYSHFGFDCACLLFDYRLDSHSLHTIPRNRTVSHVDATAPGAITPELFAKRERMADTALVPYDIFRLQMTRLFFHFELWSATPDGASEPDAWAIIDTQNNRIEEWWGSTDGRLEIAAEYASGHPGPYRLESPCDKEMNGILRNHCVTCGPQSRTVAVLNARLLLEALAPFVPAGFTVPPEVANDGPALTRLLLGPGRDTAELPFYMPHIFHV